MNTEQQKVLSFLRGNWFKISLVIIALIIAISFYQSLVIIPREKAESEASEKTLKEITEKTAQEDKQNQLDTCLSTASGNYTNNWNGSCKSLGKLTVYCQNITGDKGFSYYLENNNNATSSFEDLNIYLKARENCSCLLPNATAERWDNLLKEEKQECYNRYK